MTIDRLAKGALRAWLGGGWVWAVALLVLPGCDLVFRLDPPNGDPNFAPGPLPRMSAIFCDVEKFSVPRRCATQDDLAGVRKTQAAIALNTRQVGGNFALDYSPASRLALGCGDAPVVIAYEGPFPEGTSVCLNCSQVGPATLSPPPPYAAANAVCVAVCKDLNDGTVQNTPPDLATFCQNTARVSTNAPVDDCQFGACTPAGAENPLFDNPDDPSFIDPRRVPERIVWDPGSIIGVTSNGSSLTRGTPSVDLFDAGASATQWILRGDAFVEFSASEANLSHVLGLSVVPAGCANVESCPDTDPTLTDIDFGLSLNRDGFVFVLGNGNVVAGPFPAYAAGERFRITVTVNPDETLTIAYARLAAPCAPGAPCNASVFFTHAGGAAPRFPLRIGASFRETGATIEDVRVVRIR